MLTRTEKTTYLKMNGWWAHYHMDCWFDGRLDKLSVDGDGLIIGFRPENEGLTLEEAYSQQWKKMNQSYTNEDANRGDEDWVDGEDRGDDDNSSYGEEYDDEEYDY